jgi:hypothetical protein
MIITCAAAIMKAAPIRLVIANRATDEPDAALQCLTKQAVKSCREGRLSKATRIVDEIDRIITSANPASSIPRRLSAAEEQDLVARLFPPATDRDILRVVPDNVEALQLETEEIVRSIKRLKVDKAAGHSGLTNKLLRRLLTHGSEPDQLAIAMALTRVFNRLLSGKMPRSVRPLWLTGRAVFIPKSGSDTLRPLGISETLYRFMGSIVSSKRGPSIGQSLLPIQVGLGIPGGAEIGAVVSDLGYQRNRCESTLHLAGFASRNDDVENAYNSMPRSVQQEGLFRSAPDLLHLHYWSLNATTPLFNSSGSQVGVSATGGNQGDPFTQIYFAVGLQPMLKEVLATMRAIEERQGVAPEDQGTLVAYHDDINVSGTTPVIFELSMEAEALFLRYGLKINLRKSHILGPKVHETPNAPPDWRLESHSASTLGRPLGAIDSQAEAIAASARAAQPPLLGLRYLPALSRFQILKNCVNHRLDYLRKVVSHKVIDYTDEFREYDTKIDMGLAEIMTPSDVRSMPTLRSLPVHLGGLGMPRLLGPEHARHALVARLRVRNYLITYYPQLVVVHESFYATERGAGTDLKNEISVLAAEEPNGYDPDSLADVDKVSRCAVAKLQGVVFRSVFDNLRSDPRTQFHAASLLSQANEHSGKWLTASSSFQHRGGTQLTQIHFVESLRHRSLLDFSVTSAEPPLHCPCRRNRNAALVDLTNDPSHCLVCPMNQPLVNERHHEIVGKVGNFLKTCGYTVNLEPRAHGTIQFGHGLKRPDLAYTKAGHTAFLDVVVAEPTAASCRNDGLHSSLVQGNGAAIIAELRKNEEYRNMPPGLVVTPFALESTGRIGPAALAFLNIACADRPAALKMFISDLSICLSAHLGRIIGTTRRRTTPPNYG